jgi:hypothetical protein
MRIALALAVSSVLCAAVACSTPATTTPDRKPGAGVASSSDIAGSGSAAAGSHIAGSGSGTGAASSSWDRVHASYGRLLPVAGAGVTDVRGANEWKPAFEGGRAVDAELSRPHMAMADAAGNIYIADKEAHAVRRVAADGTITTVAGTGSPSPVDDTPGPATQRALGNPNGLFVQPDGTLYILDLDHDRVRKVTPAGEMSTLFEVPGGISIGRGLWVAPDESEVLVASLHVIERWTPRGGVTRWAAGFADLGNLARDASGRVLVGDRGADRVYALTIDAAGTVVKTPIAGTGRGGTPRDGDRALDTPLDGPRAVWPAHPADGDGFFVGTHAGCQLWFVDELGVAHLVLDGARDAHAGDGEAFSTAGAKVSELRSVTLDAAGTIIIVEDDRGRVRKIERLTR